MERIDRRALNLVPQTAALAAWQVMRSKVRAYSHQGHGPRADHQAGYISATSDSTTSLAKGSRSIHISDFRQHHLTCEGQPVHTYQRLPTAPPHLRRAA